MINTNDILETINMIRAEHLDIRTITMGISLLDCVDSDSGVCADKIYDKSHIGQKNSAKPVKILKRNTAFRLLTSVFPSRQSRL